MTTSSSNQEHNSLRTKGILHGICYDLCDRQQHTEIIIHVIYSVVTNLWMLDPMHLLEICLLISKVQWPSVDTSNAIDNFDCWIRLGIVVHN